MSSIRSNIYNKLVTLLTAVFLSTFFIKLFSMPVKCALLAVIIFLCILINRRNLRNVVILGIASFLFIALLYQLMGNGESFNNYLIKSLYILVGLLLTISLNKFTRGQQSFLLFLTFFLFLFTISMTFMVLLIDPMAVRHYGYGADEADMFMESTSLFGMYSYGVGETFAFMMPAFLCFSLGSKNIILKYVILMITVMGIITQYMATLTTSFLLSLGCSVLVLLFFFKGVGVKIKKMLLVGLLLCPLIIYLVPQLSEYENIQFLTKMEDIQHSINSGESSGQLQTRENLYMQSIEVFLSNPVLGLGNIESSENRHGTRFVSMHTTIFDYLGLYGLFALFLFISWKKILYRGLNVLPHQIQRVYKIPLLGLLGLLLLKGPVSIGVNFFFSTFLLTLLYNNEYYRIQNDMCHEK